MKANARDARAKLDRPSADCRLYLFHGPDTSAAADLAARLATAIGADAERIDLDGATLKNDPARLADEAASLSLFGTTRYIRVSPAGEESLDAFTTLLAADRAGNPVIALAPTIKSTAKILKLAVDSRHALAVACYEPSQQESEAIAATLAREAGLRPTGDSARRLVAAAGGDRAVIQREVEKLALYLDAAPDRPADLDDAALDAVGADLGDAEMTRLVTAVIEGNSAALGHELGRLDEAGVSPIPWLRQLARRLIALADMRGDIDRGGEVGAVLKRHRVFFREEAATARALRRWSPAMLTRALERVRTAERAVMASATAGRVLADHEVLAITHAVERRG
ncbi:DNA polymerase III subunit delta [Sphingomonas oligophenolica]|uniref:DNA-directed DNA polymerase n=1 Tax=Sphingomonas oligophenolica TaxID=301154 RepID=A0A502CPP9_9SPHN|nr:DNA polymerase III subunit delta [Sphingomonas oligophenolica]TPG15615.1 DNA polymerase III subunit delta [Sphingomonas oligophenolica]